MTSYLDESGIDIIPGWGQSPCASGYVHWRGYPMQKHRLLVLYFGCAMHSICSRCTALSARTVQQSLDASITEEPRNCEAPKTVAKKNVLMNGSKAGIRPLPCRPRIPLEKSSGQVWVKNPTWPSAQQLFLFLRHGLLKPAEG